MPDFVRYPHAALSRASPPRPVDAQMLDAGSRLLAAAQEVQAYGLAAAHLGLDEPVVVFSNAPASAPRNYNTLFNPLITLLADETAIAMEGSVSLPGIEVPMARAVWVEIAYDDAHGRRHTDRFEGFAARVAQHEIDQMNGVFFLQRLSRLKREMALRRWKKHPP
jgi:peptide deformylase